MGFIFRLILAAGVITLGYLLVTSEKGSEIISNNDFFSQDLFSVVGNKSSVGNQGVVFGPEGEIKSGTSVGDDEGTDSINLVAENPIFSEIFKKIKEEEKEGLKRNEEAEETFKEEYAKLPAFNFICFPTAKKVCTLDDCTKSAPGSIFTVLNKDTGVISFCEPGNCTSYSAGVKTGGGYEIYQPQSPEGRILVKEGSRFVEVALEGITTLIYSGYCAEK